MKVAASMTWKGQHPVVEVVMTSYKIGVKLTKQGMKQVEAQLERLAGLDKWFVDIVGPSPASRDT